MMPRNLHRRVEILFPIQDKRLGRYIREDIIGTYLQDETNVRLMQPDGTFARNPLRNAPDAFSAQAKFLKSR